MGSKPSSKTSGLRANAPLFLALAAWLLASPASQAQTPTVRAKAAAPAAPDTSPLARFVPKENLVVYLEFAGLDAHEAAWKNTSSYKMLTETTLGEMLGAVSEQLLDKVMNFIPGHRLSGSEIVSLIKHSARSGWVVALNADSKAGSGFRGTFVLRGGANKENRPLTSRLMGWVMGSAKPKVEKKEGRNLVVVPAAGAATPAAGAGGWAWWAEKNDLVVGFMDPSSADSIIATLDGKTPSAVEHAVIKELAQPEGKLEPVCFGFAEPAPAAGGSTGSSTFLHSLKSEWGADRVDLRWGFEGDALVSVVRLVAAKPRKGALAVFDGATFNKTSLLPLPEQIDSFIETSVSLRHLVESIKQMAPSSAVKDQIDEIAESIRGAGAIDLEKDLLAHLGPKMVAYLGTGRSATTNDDSLESALKNGWSPTAMISAMQSQFPKLTIVAEVKNPEAFSKALDGVIVALNGELKIQAIDKANEERKEAEKKDAGGAGRGPGGRAAGGGGGDRTKSRRSVQPPRFLLTPTAGKAKVYILTTPSGSPLHLGPTSFRPTIELDGDHVVFAVSPEAARNALAAVRRKDWKPPDDLAKVFEGLADNLVLLAVNDVTDTLPPLLASLPGTLQTMINTSVALARAKAGAAGADTGAAGTAPPATASTSRPPGPPLGGGRRGGMAAPGGSTSIAPSSGRPGGGGGPPNVSMAGNSGNSNASGGSTGEPAIVFNIDAEKLPKASDLKSYLFPSTITISVTDQDIRIVSRQAFPDLASLVSAVPMLGMMPGASAIVDLSKLADASQAPGAAGTGSARPGAGGAAAGPGGQPPTSKGAGPGGRRGGGAAPRPR